MIVAMAYLLSIHILRQIYDDGKHTLDITGPLMIITQKVTSLAFSIHDGFVRQTKVNLNINSNMILKLIFNLII